MKWIINPLRLVARIRRMMVMVLGSIMGVALLLYLVLLRAIQHHHEPSASSYSTDLLIQGNVDIR